MQLSLIAAPYDSGRLLERMGAGPRHLLEHGLPERLREAGHEVADAGRSGAGGGRRRSDGGTHPRSLWRRWASLPTTRARTNATLGRRWWRRSCSDCSLPSRSTPRSRRRLPGDSGVSPHTSPGRG